MIVKKKQKNAGLAVYFCGTCKAWHLCNSKEPWKVQARIDQLLSIVK